MSSVSPLTHGRMPGSRAGYVRNDPLGVTPPGVSVTRLGPREVVRELYRHGYRRVWLVGGGKLAGSFRGEGLVREYIVATILGAGIPFLASYGPKEDLKLVHAKTYPNGVVQLRYQPETATEGTTDENGGRDGERIGSP